MGGGVGRNLGLISGEDSVTMTSRHVFENKFQVELQVRRKM